MKKTVLIVLLPLFADWEVAFISSALNDQIQNKESQFLVKTVSLTKEPVISVGGLTVLADYDIEHIPDKYAALFLIGGMSWCTKDRKQTECAQKLIPLVQQTIDNKIVVGAICDATTFLGANGYLNHVKHTSNTLADLKNVADMQYTNEKSYIEEQAVCDQNIITANGTAYLEFTKEVLIALNAYSIEDIGAYYDFYKQGYYKAIKKHHIAKGI